MNENSSVYNKYDFIMLFSTCQNIAKYEPNDYAEGIQRVWRRTVFVFLSEVSFRCIAG